MSKCFTAILSWAVATAALAGDVPEWRVVGVHDGDTLTAVDGENKQHKVRLHGIDAPEIGQPFGSKSRDALAALTMRKTVAVHSRGHDRYGRDLARIEVDGRDVNRQLVADGFAWHYAHYDQSSDLTSAEREARREHRGLWAEKAPVPPWEWRATERERKAEQDRKPGKSASAGR